jgi:ParB family chromosome partitioning protein
VSKKGLGKGFDSLIPNATTIDSVTTPVSEKIHSLAIDVVLPKSGQPRQVFNDSELQQLAISIEEQGVLQPIIVTEVEHNLYSIIAGERRWRASKIAGRTHIPAIIKKVNELEHLELALLENVQRSDLNAIETAKSIERLHNEFGQSYEDIALRLGKGYTTIVNAVRLLQLPKDIQESLMSGEISEGHGRALLALAKHPNAQRLLFKDIVTKKLSVRQAEAFAAVAKSNAEQGRNIKTTNIKTHKQNKISETLSKNLGVKVDVPNSKSKGKITINYTSPAEYEKILKILNKK